MLKMKYGLLTQGVKRNFIRQYCICIRIFSKIGLLESPTSQLLENDCVNGYCSTISNTTLQHLQLEFKKQQQNSMLEIILDTQYRNGYLC